MNYFRYVDKYGCYTFAEVPFTEVDNIIFSSLSYIDFNGIVSRNRFGKITIKEAGELFFKKYVKKEKNILSIKNAIKILKNIMLTRRYGDLLLYNYVYEVGGDEQFSALTIEINKKLVYVSFEGTDQMISGWKEDFMLSYKFPVLAQRKAIDYLNKNFLFRRKEIIVGGHSKGGNLAMVSAMYCNFLVRDRIRQVYNNDGPGLLLEQLDSKYYKYVEKKLIHIIPNYSIFGLLLRNSGNYTVIRSARKGLFAHDLSSWVVEDRLFVRAELSAFSKKLDDGLVNWMIKYDKREREKFVLSLFEIFDKAGIVSLVDIMENKKLVFHLISISKDMDKETKIIVRDLFVFLFKCFKDVKREEFLSFFDKN